MPADVRNGCAIPLGYAPDCEAQPRNLGRQLNGKLETFRTSGGTAAYCSI